MKTAGALLLVLSGIFGTILAGKSELVGNQIEGAEAADPGDFLVEIRSNIFGFPQHYCYAALIDEQWVLVTAKCVEKKPWVGSLEVLVGSKTFGIKTIILHENFKEYANNIALVRLNSRAPPSNTGVKPIYLPNSDVQPADTASFIRKDKSGKTEAFIVNVKNASECPQSVGSIGSGQFCAGDKEKSGLQGEEGNPLMAFNRFQAKVIVGLLSFAEPKPATALFTNVYTYTAWILAQIIQASGPSD